jgi:hypothetical protein
VGPQQQGPSSLALALDRSLPTLIQRQQQHLGLAGRDDLQVADLRTG